MCLDMATTRRITRQRNGRLLLPGSQPSPPQNHPPGVVFIDLVDSDSDGEGNLEEQFGNLEEDDDEIADEEFGGWRVAFDFESSNALPNLTVKSFLRDCYEHPKILCHKRFQALRHFIEEATGFKFQLPVDAVYQMDHEDDTFCVDKGDKWLADLKERIQQQKAEAVARRERSKESEEDSEEDSDDDDDEEEEEELPPYFWATYTLVQRRNDLGLVIFRWTPKPLSLSFLDLYVRFCKNKYKPPPPPPPTPPPPTVEVEEAPQQSTSRGRRGRNRGRGRMPTRRSLRHTRNIVEMLSDMDEEKVEVEPVSAEEAAVVNPEEKEEEAVQEEVDHGVDGYVKDLARVLDLERNMDVEDRYKGDIDARAQRQREGKEEPKYSRELSLLLRRNPVLTTPVKQNSRKGPTPRGEDTDSETTASSASSVSLASRETKDSDFRVGPITPVSRKLLPKRGEISMSNPSPKMMKQLANPPVVVLNGVKNMMISLRAPESTSAAMPSPSTRSSTSSGISAGSSASSGSSSMASRRPARSSRSGGGSPSKKTKFTCEVCRPPKDFVLRKSFYRHMEKQHKKKRVLVKCECGIQVRKEGLQSHKRFACSRRLMEELVGAKMSAISEEVITID